MTETALASTNWQALLRLKLCHREHRTQLVPIERYGPLSVQRPFYPEGECCHVYLLHPPGGVVDGDSLELQLDHEPDSKALLTTPGATKFYASAGDTARVRQHFEVASGAQLEYLPNENIYFPGARVDSITTVDVKPGGTVMLWEKHCFGRPANHEFFDKGKLVSQIVLNRDGRPVFIDRQCLDPRELNRASGLRGYAVIGSFLIYGMEPDRDLIGKLQQITAANGICAITCPQDNLLIARYIGNSTSDLDDYFVSLWELTRSRALNRAACHPRIWRT